jgi:phage shock protein A
VFGKKKMSLMEVLHVKILCVEDQSKKQIEGLDYRIKSVENSHAKLLDELRMTRSSMEIQTEDKLHSLSDQYVAIQTSVLEALARRPDVDAEFLHKRIVLLEMQVKDLSAKLLELSPQLS